MTVLSSVMTYLGLGNAAELEVINAGKRRTVTYLSFLVFALFVGAIEDDYWIVGGLVIQPPAPQRRSLGDGLMLNDDLMTSGPHSIFMFDSAEDAEVPHGRKLQASPSVDFYIGLKTFIQDYQGFPQYPNRAYYNSSGIARPTITTQTIWPLETYISYFNTLTGVDGNFISGGGNFGPSTGAKPVNPSIFKDTLGLIGTASFFAIVAWLGMILVNHGIPQVVAYKWTFHIIGGMSVAAAFFGMVGVALFGSSGLKDEFCKVYDPPVDETSNIRSVPCGYSQGFDLAIAGLTFSLLQALLFFFWMPHAAGSAKYEFSEVGKGFGEGAAEAPKASFAAVSSSGTSASGYQDI